MKPIHSTYLILPLLLLLSAGCGAYLHQPLRIRNARLGEETAMTPLLRSLPAPRDPVVAAVYKFRDQTGQYKPSDLGANWSTAVTQGATSILIRVMEESGWFIPIERENVSNLLNERKIIRSSRAQYEREEEEQYLLPPLLFAGMILEGGIISYDANLITGGAGLRYFGAGGSGQYRQDRVTVYLRAVSTTNGKVLKTIYTSKTLLSQAVDVGLFRFVSFRRLLEVETGFTYNEPSEMAVTEAIEKAVYCLILEGINDGLWEASPTDQIRTRALLEAYNKEKIQQRQTDLLGREFQGYRTAGMIQLNAGGLLYEGDYPNSALRAGVDLGAEIFISPGWALGLNGGYNQLAAEAGYEERIGYFEVNAVSRLLPWERFTPFLFGGGGLLFDQGDGEGGPAQRDYYWKLNGGIGFEYRLTDFLGAGLSIDQNYLLSDRIDGISQGRYNDFYWRARLGIRLYLNN